MHPHICFTHSFIISVESSESFHHRKTPLRCQGRACVDVMTTLHGSTPYLRRRVRGSVPLEGTIPLPRDPSNDHPFSFKA